MIDISHPEVSKFLCRCQSKIGELGTYISERKHDDSSLKLSKELIDVVTAILLPMNNWSEKELFKVIDYYNTKACLDKVPYVAMIGYKIICKKGSGGGDTSGIVDYVDQQIAAIQHNSLKGIQGGKVGEYYHLTKAQYDWVADKSDVYVEPQLTLFVQPDVVPVIVNGTYLLNSGVGVTAVRYYRDNVLKVEYAGDDVDLDYEDPVPVTSTTTYRYEVDFIAGGTKSISRTVSNTLPYFSGQGVTGLDRVTTNRVNVPSRPGSMDIKYTIPTGNATTKLFKLYAMYPKEWGLPKNVYVNGATLWDTVNMWKPRQTTVVIDGVAGEYYTLEYDEYTEGTFTFNFRWVAI